ncbi:MAG: ACT domain-containing protein [Marmoricola sp.]
MSYLLRVQLPDVPGSLGRLATAIGAAGGNIDAIEIVSRSSGFAIDDVFLAADTTVMPDSIVSACQQLKGVEVLWISRYAAGTNLFLDLEAVEAMTQSPHAAADTLVDLVPQVFRADWGVRARRNGDHFEVLHRTSAAPTELPEKTPWPAESVADGAIEELLLLAAPLGADEAVVIARRGGPEFMDSELARLRHLVQLAGSIAR